MAYKNKECEISYRKKYYQQNKEKLIENSKKYYQDNKSRALLTAKNYRDKNPGWFRNSNYLTKYGITLEEYNILFEKQNGCCAICGKHQSELNKRLSVDHDHSSGKNRGLLCTNCNHGLGKFSDSLEFLENAVSYLRSYLG